MPGTLGLRLPFCALCLWSLGPTDFSKVHIQFPWGQSAPVLSPVLDMHLIEVGGQKR